MKRLAKGMREQEAEHHLDADADHAELVEQLHGVAVGSLGLGLPGPVRLIALGVLRFPRRARAHRGGLTGTALTMPGSYPQHPAQNSPARGGPAAALAWRNAPWPGLTGTGACGLLS